MMFYDSDRKALLEIHGLIQQQNKLLRNLCDSCSDFAGNLSIQGDNVDHLFDLYRENQESIVELPKKLIDYLSGFNKEKKTQPKIKRKYNKKVKAGSEINVKTH